MSRTVYHFLKIVPADIIYNVLPLYHIAGGVLGVGHCLMNGCTLVIRRKFSASRFWDDCCTYNCTVSIQLYLLNMFLFFLNIKFAYTYSMYRND